MKRNVTLFSILAVGALYLLYGAEEKHTTIEDIQIESVSTIPEDSETRIYHTRKLLSLESPNNRERVDSAWTSSGNVLDDTNSAHLELLGKEAAQNFGNNKFNRRRKRRAPNPKQQFAWNFNLNVTRYENNGTTSNYPVDYPIPSDKKLSKSDDRYLGMAMSVSGNGPDQTVEDLYQAWDSVGKFLRSLFGGNLEELKGKGHGVSVDVSSIPNGTIELPHELFLEGSGEEESQESRNRRGKFLLGIFGFGGNQENPPRDEGSGEVSDIQEFNDTESEENKFGNEIKDLSSTLETLSNGAIGTVPSLLTTENSKESLTSSLGIDPTSFATSDPRNSTELTSTSSITEEAISVGKCTNCELQTESFASTDDKILTEPNPTSNTPISNTITTHFPLSEETLKDFCIALLSRMRTSGRSVEVSQNLEGSGSFEINDVNTHASTVLTDKPRSQNLGFFESIWNRIVGRKVVPAEESLAESRGARLINFSSLNFNNLFAGFGSGRSADSGENSNIEFDNFNADLTDNIEEGEQFLLECEEFLRSVQTETRPNIFDLVDPHPIEIFPTEFTTSSTEIQQLNEKDGTTRKEVFTIPSISQPDSRVEQTSSNLQDNQLTTPMQVKQFTETTHFENLVFTEVQVTGQNDSIIIQNLVMEKNTGSQDVSTTQILDIPILTDVTELESTTTDSNLTDLNEDRSFNVFGFGSGTEEGSTDISNTKERFFLGGLLGLIAGSGGREITNDISTEDVSDGITESSKERSFGGAFSFGSGEREIKEIDVSVEDSSDKTTDSSKERSLGSIFSFGSGERGIKEIDISTNDSSDKTESSKERSFGGLFSFGSGEREIKEIDMSTEDSSDKTTESSEKRSFGGVLSFGSGERELPEAADLTTGENEIELLVHPSLEEGNMTTHIPLITSSFPVNIPVQSIPPDSNRVDYQKSEIYTEINEVTEGRYRPTMPEDTSVSISLSDKMVSSTEVLSIDEYKTFETGLEVVTNMVQPPFPIKQETTSSAAITEIPLESTTVINKSRFLGTIFLTGSGEGGLFVDNKGPINLVQESEFTSPDFQQSFQPRRGARKHDIQFQEPKETIIEPRVTTPFQSTSESNFITSQTPTDKTTTLKTFVTEAVNETEDTTEFLDINDNIVASVDTVQPEHVMLLTPTVQSELAKVTVTSIPTVTNATKVPESVTTIGVISSTVININPRSKITEPPQRFCTSASQCNIALNERCMFDGPLATCNCGRSYVRSPETGRCNSPVVLKTSLKLPGEVFHPDLNNRNSSRFRKMMNDSIETMWILLGDDPDLFRLVAGVSVSSFEEGSLVVHWEITLAAPENESVAQLVAQLDAELREAFEDEALLRRAPLNVHDAVLMAVTNDIDPCEKTEHNYCSINADCFRDTVRNFKCRCKGDYLDQSTDLNHPGEICIETCPAYYCGDHGDCKLKQNGDLLCACHSWYFGDKCEISGIIVIAGFASFNVLLIIIVLFLVCYCRKRRYRQSRFYDENRVRFQPEAELGRFTASPRLADNIALGDVGGPAKASKYMAVSTPLRLNPEIRLTSPSILGSSVDYDYDSTFDRTPSVEEINVEVHKSGATPKA